MAEYILARDWNYGGGPDDKHAKKLEAGTSLGKIEINDDVPMTPHQLADAVHLGLAREARPDDESASKRVSATKGRSKVKDE